MGSRMNRQAYEKMIVENLEWLRKQPRTLEREHIEMILEISADREYGVESNKIRDSFQRRVEPWLHECFGAAISSDVVERNHRFLEEALELVQTTGCTASEAHQLVDYVFNRPIGERKQEIGGVMVTLAALCLAIKEDMHKAGEDELDRIWTKVELIREKQRAKPKHSPLPIKNADGW
jgi:hypothetical protein